MEYTETKKHFQAKKQKNKEFYVLKHEYTNDLLLLDKRIVEIMLTQGFSFGKLLNNDYLKYLGSCQGKDSKFYDKYTLNELGNDLYETSQTNQLSPDYIQALDELNKNENNLNLSKEKERIKKSLNRNFINQLYYYNDLNNTEGMIQNSKTQETQIIR